MREKFMFFANFKETADKLPDDLRLKFYDAMTDYVFNGVEPDDNLISALITAIKPSLDKVDERGGARDGAGRPKSNEIKNNQNNSNEIKRNQNNQSFLETETETRNGNKKQETEKYGELGYVRLTAEQYATLKEKYPNLDAAIEVLDTWLGKNSKSAKEARGKNHYAYFKQNSWVWERLGEQRKPTESVDTPDTGEKSVLVEEGQFYIDDTMPEYRENCQKLTDDELEKAWKWIMDHFRGKKVSVDFVNGILKKFDSSCQFREAQGF